MDIASAHNCWQKIEYGRCEIDPDDKHSQIGIDYTSMSIPGPLLFGQELTIDAGELWRTITAYVKLTCKSIGCS